MPSFTIESLHIYPLKSGQGLAVEEAEVHSSGLQDDRICAVINAENTVLTGRECQKLLAIKTKIKGNEIRFSTENKEVFELDLNTCKTHTIEAELFREPFNALEVEGSINDWLSEFLGEPCRLILNNQNNSRTVRHVSGKNPIALSDACPIHLINKSSLDDLSNRMGTGVASARFRPNIVISGVAPYEEENWTHLQIGERRYQVVLKTKRCTMITINPETQQKHPEQEPLRELGTYKRAGGKINFGIYLIPEEEGRISIHDSCKAFS